MEIKEYKQKLTFNTLIYLLISYAFYFSSLIYYTQGREC